MSVRGYADWSPKPEARHWIAATREVVDAYRSYWPLTVRQIFYRLVADHEYPKTEAAYGKLTQIISRSRRAGFLPWDAIRDGGLGKSVSAVYFLDEEDFYERITETARQMKLNRQRDQGAVIELWCEAGGMVPILQGIAAPYSARVNSGGGYDSVTAKHRLAERVRDRAEGGLKTVILHVGDFDASGEDMADVLREDTGRMVVTQILRAVYASGEEDGWTAVPSWVIEGLADEGSSGLTWRRIVEWALGFFEVQRVALTGDQVIERQVETAPPKKSDSRTAEFVRRNEWVAAELGTSQITAQLEALTPPELEEVVREAIEAVIDLDAYEAVLAEEEDVRTALLGRLER